MKNKTTNKPTKTNKIKLPTNQLDGKDVFTPYKVGASKKSGRKK